MTPELIKKSNSFAKALRETALKHPIVEACDVDNILLLDNFSIEEEFSSALRVRLAVVVKMDEKSGDLFWHAAAGFVGALSREFVTRQHWNKKEKQFAKKFVAFCLDFCGTPSTRRFKHAPAVFHAFQSLNNLETVAYIEAMTNGQTTEGENTCLDQ